jgi:PhnB protein
MRADPYLFFHGRCAEALDFYRRVLGAKIEALIRFGDMPGASAAQSENVMHAALRIGDTVILASDGGGNGESAFDGFSIALQVETDAAAEQLFATLGDGGKIEVPLMSTPFASRFGKLADRFGTPWMIVTQPHTAR